MALPKRKQGADAPKNQLPYLTSEDCALAKISIRSWHSWLRCDETTMRSHNLAFAMKRIFLPLAYLANDFALNVTHEHTCAGSIVLSHPHVPGEGFQRHRSPPSPRVIETSPPQGAGRAGFGAMECNACLSCGDGGDVIGMKLESVLLIWQK